jgi:ATP-dependent RNA helicase DDX52/ROK1
LWGVLCAVAGSLLAGNDTHCIAPTGSGKTLAYLLPTLVNLRDPARSLQGEAQPEGEKHSRAVHEGKGIRALILVPTHDLAVQIHEVLRTVTKGRHWRCMVLTKATEVAVCEASPGPKGAHVKSPTERGESEEVGNSQDEEDDEEVDEDEEDGESDEELDIPDDESMGSVNEFAAAPGPAPDGGLGIDILIATPERLHHLLTSSRLSLAHTRYLVMDEAERLVSPDFLPQVEPIVNACTNPSIQKCLLSATIPAGDKELARTWLKDGGV